MFQKTFKKLNLESEAKNPKSILHFLKETQREIIQIIDGTARNDYLLGLIKLYITEYNVSITPFLLLEEAIKILESSSCSFLLDNPNGFMQKEILI